ncbi:hypothetical protein CRG98_011620 [Punica granatum]|uniref:Uncharacterized protein n=1 Tax=Punica granatum TaxID=22663 RepID=A0A2I0KHN7_PUNGR|nr:hypothetical protein CRG98_011620 [Punica granatum]
MALLRRPYRPPHNGGGEPGGPNPSPLEIPQDGKGTVRVGGKGYEVGGQWATGSPTPPSRFMED